MGLKEKRAIEAVRTRDLPTCEAEIERYLGVGLPISVDWDGLEAAGEDAIFAVNGMGLRKLAGAMLIASNDAFVKGAFVDALTGLGLVHVPDNASKGVFLSDGVATLRVNFTDTAGGQLTDQQIFNALMEAL